MKTYNTAVTVWTLGDVARHFRLPLWQIRRLFERGLLPEPGRVGHFRVVAVGDLPKVEDALRAAGYLTPANGYDRQPDASRAATAEDATPGYTTPTVKTP